MTFESTPLIPGDFYEFAERFSFDAEKKLSVIVDSVDYANVREELWHEILALGWTSMLIPEEFGGVGGSLSDLVAIIEGSSRFALPLPVLTATAVVPLVLMALAGNRKPLLEDIATAQTAICPILQPLDSFCGAMGKPSTLEIKSEEGVLALQGEAFGVEVILGATDYLIACRDGNEPVLILCSADQKNITAVERVRMDRRMSYDLYFDGVAIKPADILARGYTVESELEKVHALSVLLTSVEAVSAMGQLISQTIEYLSCRKQFGVNLSTFQVLRHHVVDMYAAYENFRAQVTSILDKAVAGEDIILSASLLKYRLSSVSKLVGHTAIQLHGGMGVTEELQATRLAKRILMAEFEYGDGAFHGEKLLLSCGASA